MKARLDNTGQSVFVGVAEALWNARNGTDKGGERQHSRGKPRKK